MPYRTGSAFLEQYCQFAATRTQLGTTTQLNERKRALLGTSLSYLYQIGICYPKCHGGDRVLEALVGRCFNHCAGSLRMISDWLYDESLNLTRSVAEIVNLIMLFDNDPSSFATWKNSTRKERLAKFSPAAVRKALADGGWPVPADDDRYRELCEVATHVTPDTKPNNHSSTAGNVGFLGGVFEQTGHSQALENLLFYCSLSSMIACKIFGFEDRVEELAELGKGTFSSL